MGEKLLGEWSTLDIVAAGDTLTRTVNGVQLNRMTGVPPATSRHTPNSPPN
jgi:hypothetical protein